MSLTGEGNCGDFDDEGRRSWLRRVCTNKWIDDIRRRQRSRELHPQVHRLYERSAPDPADVVIAREDLDRCWQVIRGLPAIRRQVAILYFVEGRSDRSIADLLGTQPANIRKHVGMACKALRTALGDDFSWGTLEAGAASYGPAAHCQWLRVRSAHGRSETPLGFARRFRDLGARAAAHAGRGHAAACCPVGPCGRTYQSVRLEPGPSGDYVIDREDRGGGHTEGSRTRRSPGDCVPGGGPTGRKDHARPGLAESGRGTGCRLPGPGGAPPVRWLPSRALAPPS
ncbi:RNA polymerase sigma factor [Streptomyces sp. A1136]|uniref:RNA polymerase sigma factor n=1 Tax=Streptomyces sp. A1136 TaxID=2563102 RepID=UPI0034D2CC1A